MLVAVRYLGNETITGITYMEDWYLPKDAFKTQFKDAAGRTLYLIGKRKHIVNEATRMDKKGATLHHYGYTFTFQGK